MSKTDLIITLFLSNSLLFATTMGFAIAWVRARDRALRARIDALSGVVDPARGTAQLERAIDAIALEVERISEGQRFTTRLLAERERGAGDSRASSQKSAITPH